MIEINQAVAHFLPSDHLIFLTNRLARLLASDIRPRLGGQYRDVNGSAIGVLTDLWVRDGVPINELGSSRIKSRSSMRQLVKILLSKQLVRVANKEGEQIVYLTAAGKDMQEMVESASRLQEQEALPDVSLQDLHTTKRVLGSMYQTLLSPNTQVKHPDGSKN